ncbi:MAG: response regulator [Bradyrhizobium sp.]|uniref:ATP-binding response regulator n=1 Tax=Bradyrhizobium sp. TaxID=376 RepID=UPI001D9E032F|nr:response regulator [Bradyrhizobium sp.]MBV9562017.1 response regulator [Bradyrhizobium sp.]
MMPKDLTHRLLVVEDNPGDALLVSEALTEITNYRLSVDEVTSLKQASAALKADAFDGIILDLTLPDSTGIETLSQVRAISNGEPIIVLTGLDAGSGLREEAEQLGAFEFVSKNEMSQLLPRSVHWTLRHKRDAVQHRQFERLVTAIPDAIIVTDRAGIISFVNAAAFDLFGRRGDDLIGGPLGFTVRPGEVSETEIVRDHERRSCEVRVVECEWNSVPAYLVLVRDMTEQKRLSEQLQHAQKMEAVGLMAGGVAHDFNNLLLVMLVYAEMMRDDCAAEDPKRADVIEILHSIDRARALTGQLLAFSRKQPTLPTVLNLSEVVAGMHSMLRRTLPASIEIVTLADNEAWPVMADRGQIEQVLMNLAVNARDALKGGGRFAIEIENEALARTDHGLTPGDYVVMRVADNGSGISPEHLDRIFDPFFTTKERGRGTGLGLATCYGIVAQAGGRLSVESTLGVGTSFLIQLPRTRRQVGTQVDAETEMEGPGGNETILVVEDDHAVMRATTATLKKGGYRLLSAANGDEARRLVERQSDHIDLVLSDVVMPQLGGPEFAEFLTQTRPGVPVVFMTGYSDCPIASENGDIRIANRRAIMKPFRPAELLSVIREALDARPQAVVARS